MACRERELIDYKAGMHTSEDPLWWTAILFGASTAEPSEFRVVQPTALPTADSRAPSNKSLGLPTNACRESLFFIEIPRLQENAQPPRIPLGL